MNEIEKQFDQEPDQDAAEIVAEPSIASEEKTGFQEASSSEMQRLMECIYKEPEMGRLIADILEGVPAGEAARSRFKQPAGEIKEINTDAIGEIAQGWNLDEEAGSRLVGEAQGLYSRIAQGDCSAEVAAMIAKAVNYDAALARASQEGYLRGKNEKIELASKSSFNATEGDIMQDEPHHYTSILSAHRRSVWDD